MIKLVFEHSKQELIKDENDLHYVLAKLDKVRLRATLLLRVHACSCLRLFGGTDTAKALAPGLLACACLGFCWLHSAVIWLPLCRRSVALPHYCRPI